MRKKITWSEDDRARLLEKLEASDRKNEAVRQAFAKTAHLLSAEEMQAFYEQMTNAAKASLAVTEARVFGAELAARHEKASNRAAQARGGRWTGDKSIDTRDAKIAPGVRRLKRMRNLSNRGIADRLGISPARVARILGSKE